MFPGFRWDGVDWTASVVLWRCGWAAAALALDVVSAIFFDRFDPARLSWRTRTKPKQEPVVPGAETDEVSSAARIPLAVPVHLTPLGNAGRPNFVRICIAELRLSVKRRPLVVVRGRRGFAYRAICCAARCIARVASHSCLDLAHPHLVCARRAGETLRHAAAFIFLLTNLIAATPCGLAGGGDHCSSLRSRNGIPPSNRGAESEPFRLGCGRALCAVPRARPWCLERYEQIF